MEVLRLTATGNRERRRVWSRRLLAVVAAAALVMILAGSSGATQRYLELLPGNSTFGGVSDDGSKLFFSTDIPLDPSDTDVQVDVYEQSNGQLTLVSTGPTGGNGAFGAFFMSASPDGSHVVFRTFEPLVATDTDSSNDFYVRSGGQTELVTQGATFDGGLSLLPDAISQDGSHIYFRGIGGGGPLAGSAWYQFTGGQTSVVVANGGPLASSCGSSADGTRFFVTTISALVPSDTDNGDPFFHANKDVYEISNGQATLVSTGPSGANGPFDACCVGKSLDGTRVFFATAEPLVAADTDTQEDVYERSTGQTTLISTGPDGGNGAFDASLSNPGISDDGDHVVFSTSRVARRGRHRQPVRPVRAIGWGDDAGLDRAHRRERRKLRGLRRSVRGRITCVFPDRRTARRG